MKTMGFTQLFLVKPGKMAEPGHVMAVKMAVKSWDVLEAAGLVETRRDGKYKFHYLNTAPLQEITARWLTDRGGQS